MSFYGSSGDLRSDLGGGLPSTHPAYKGETEIPGDLIERGRKNAYALINAKLEVAYPSQVPWASGSEPALVYEISNKLAMCYIYERKNPGPAPLNKDIKATYCKEPTDLLDKLASFDMQLPEIEAPYGEKVYHSRDFTPVMDIDDELDQAPSSELLNDISEDRDS